MILLGSWVSLQLHPVSALAPLGHTLRVVRSVRITEIYTNKETNLGEPGPLDVGVLLVTDASNHPVVVHGVDDGRSILGSLRSLDCLQEERILVTSLLGQQFVLLQT